MEFDKYGRIKNPTISSPRSVNAYTQVNNNHRSRTFFLWDWFNDLVIGIGNFIANSTDFILGALAWIVIIAGSIYAISALIDVWSNHDFFIAALITIFGGGLLYTIVMIILGILSWIVAILLVIIRYIFYNAYTLLLFIGIIVGIRWYINKDHSSIVYPEQANSSIMSRDTNVVEVQDIINESDTEDSNVEEPYVEEPLIDKSIVEEINEEDPFPLHSSSSTSMNNTRSTKFSSHTEKPSTHSKGTGFCLEKVDKIPTQDDFGNIKKTKYRLEKVDRIPTKDNPTDKNPVVDDVYY